MKKIEELENRIKKLEGDEYITFNHIKKFFKVMGILALIAIAMWIVYVFFIGLNCEYGFGDRIINFYHILYG